MRKFYGDVGFAVITQIRPGVWKEEISVRQYAGDVSRNTRRFQTTAVNDDVNINNVFSIVVDPFAVENMHSIRFVVYHGVRWKVTAVEEQYPRLIINVGGVFNG